MHTHSEIGITVSAKMILQFAFHIIILTIWPRYGLASEQDPIIAQPGCNSTCRGDIPYPFEIECRDTSQGYYISDLTVERFNELNNMDYVSAVLEWEILNDMLINSSLERTEPQVVDANAS
ncbi:hypothetical protein VNO77_25531 [Canavalia gladiata]|uniref:Wall-associated receptor kinase galacturonan-binding domain-containing protein n=1 Tax=Canavalia gladiata TaxID=3824 RepID=A0AAN9QDN0_CANGL